MGSMQYAKRKGREWENATALVAQGAGFKNAERRTKKGRYDEGDIVGIPRTVIECKAEKTLNFAGAVDEAREEADNAGASIYFAAVKRRRHPSERGFFVTDRGMGLLLLDHSLPAKVTEGEVSRPGQIAKVLDDVREASVRASASLYFVTAKRRGKPEVRHYFVTDLSHGLALVRRALIAMDDHEGGVLDYLG